MLIILRLLHIVGGVLWVGMFFLMMIFIMPSIQEAGPAGGTIVQGLQRRKLLVVMPVIAIATLLSGLWLFWVVSNGFEPTYMRSAMGRTLGVGAASAILAFVLGIAIHRPAMLRTGALAETMAKASETERTAAAPELARLRARTKLSGHAILGLLFLAVAAMSVARYL